MIFTTQGFLTLALLVIVAAVIAAVVINQTGDAQASASDPPSATTLHLHAPPWAV